jgi:hypothetical protein
MQAREYEGLLQRVRLVRAPACSAGAEHALLVDPGDDPDRGVPGVFEAGEGAVEIGWTQVLLREEGPGSGLSSG